MVTGYPGNRQLKSNNPDRTLLKNKTQKNIIQQDFFTVGEVVSFQEGAVLKQNTDNIIKDAAI